MPEYSHNIRIRKMSTEDLMEVARIEKETFSLPWSQQGFADSLAQENTCYLVAKHRGKTGRILWFSAGAG